MGRIATNFNDQIALLKERGMNLDYNDPKLKEFLLDIGYYRLGFYWNPFEKDKNHNFEANTNFSDVISLYYLDVDLRNVLTKYLNRIEVNFRTKLVYYVSNKFKNSPAWFFDSKIVDQELMEKKDSFYNDTFKKNKVIKKHHNKYSNDTYAPAWKTLEFFTFGMILTIYRNIKDQDIKKRISKEFGIINIDKFTKLISSIVYVRNFCAHGDAIFDLRTPKGMPVISDIPFDQNDRSSLNACLKVISFFLEQISPNRREEFNKNIDEIFLAHKANPVLKEIVENKINYKY